MVKILMLIDMNATNDGNTRFACFDNNVVN